MSVRLVLEDIIDAVPKRPRFITRERLLALVALVSQLLSLAALRRPGLGPLHRAVTALLTPLGAANEELKDQGGQVLRKIRMLKGRLATASDEEQKRLTAQIETLVELLVQS